MPHDWPPRIDIEECSPVFTKFHIRGEWPFHPVIHRMTGEGDRGHPHDHNFDFHVFIIEGGYVEEVFELDGSSRLVTRNPLDSFTNEAGHIHRIVELLAPEVYTLILPCAYRRREGFYRWENGQVFHCYFGETNWHPYEERAA